MASAAPATLPPSQAILRQQYIDNLAYLNPLISVNLDPVVTTQSNVYAGMLSGLYANVYLYGLQIYPISTTGLFLPRQLASWELLPMSAGAYALGSCQLTATQLTDVTIPVNTQMQDENKNIFITATNTVILAGQLGVISIRSNLATSGYQLAPGSILTLATPIGSVSELEVITLNDGAGPETQESALKRLIDTTQNPPQGGNGIDYKNWALESDPSITDATVNSFKNVGTGEAEVHVDLLGGQLNIDQILANPALQYNRSVNPATVTICSNYIEGKRPATDIVIVESVMLYEIDDLITATVKLVPGYVLTDIDPNTGLSIEALIIQQIRSPIVLTSQTPTLIGSTWYIPKDSVTQAVLNALNANPLEPGTISQLLISLDLTIPNPLGFPVPDPKSTPQIIYDLPVNQTNVTVTT